MFIWNGLRQQGSRIWNRKKSYDEGQSLLCFPCCLCWLQPDSQSFFTIILGLFLAAGMCSRASPASGSFCSAEFSSMRKVPVGVRVSSRAVSGRDKWRISPGRVPAVTGRWWTVICVLSSHSSSLIKVFRARTTPGGNHSCLPCKMTVDFNSLLIWMFL